MKLEEVLTVAESVAEIVRTWDESKIQPIRDVQKSTDQRLAELVEENMRLDREMKRVFAMLRDLPTVKDGRDGIDGKDGSDGINGKDGRDGIDGKDGAPGKDGEPGPQGEQGPPGKDAPPVDLEEVARMAAALIPRPQDGAPGRDGKDGAPGRDGRDGVPGLPGEKGIDGKDGLGFDDLSHEFDGERTLALTFRRGDIIKRFEIVLPIPLDRGVFSEGTTYAKGDGVSQGGSFWIAQRETSVKPGSNDDWRLAVKRGRDAKELPTVHFGNGKK